MIRLLFYSKYRSSLEVIKIKSVIFSNYPQNTKKYYHKIITCDCYLSKHIIIVMYKILANLDKTISKSYRRDSPETF